MKNAASFCGRRKTAYLLNKEEAKWLTFYLIFRKTDKSGETKSYTYPSS